MTSIFYKIKNFILEISKNYAILFSLTSMAFLIGLLGVQISESFGLKPCAMCKIQRYMIFASAIFCISSTIFILINQTQKTAKTLVLMLFLFTLTSNLFAWYQLGVEKGVFELPSFCAQQNLSRSINAEDLFSMEPSPPCNKIQLLGPLSIAEYTLIGVNLILIWNMIISYLIFKKENIIKNLDDLN